MRPCFDSRIFYTIQHTLCHWTLRYQINPQCTIIFFLSLAICCTAVVMQFSAWLCKIVRAISSSSTIDEDYNYGRMDGRTVTFRIWLAGWFGWWWCNMWPRNGHIPPGAYNFNASIRWFSRVCLWREFNFRNAIILRARWPKKKKVDLEKRCEKQQQQTLKLYGKQIYPKKRKRKHHNGLAGAVICTRLSAEKIVLATIDLVSSAGVVATFTEKFCFFCWFEVIVK